MKTRWIGYILFLGTCWWAGVGPGLAQVPSWQPTGGPGGGHILDLAAGADDVLFALVSADGFPMLYRTHAAGAWTRVTVPLTRLRRLTTSPSGDVYLWGDPSPSGRPRILRSRDDGSAWHDVTLPDRCSTLNALAFDDTGQVFAGGCGVFAAQADTLAWTPAGLDTTTIRHLAFSPSGRLFAADAGHLYRSDDRGASWSVHASWIDASPGLDLLAMATHPSGAVVLGFGGLAGFDSTGVYHVASDGTMTRTGLHGHSVPSFDGTADGTLYAGSRGLCIGFECLSPAGVHRSTDGGFTWEASGLESTAVPALAVTTSGVLTAGTEPLFIDAGIRLARGIAQRSEPDGPWEHAGRGLPHALTYALVPGPDGTLYAAADHSLFAYTTDPGWRPLYTTVMRVDYDAARPSYFAPYYQLAVHPEGDLIALVSPYQDVRLFNTQIYEQSRVLLRAPGSETPWTVIHDGVFEQLTVTPAGTVLLTRGRDLHRSEDKGRTWTVNAGALPGIPDTFAHAPDGTLFAAVRADRVPLFQAEVSIVRSLDDGRTWLPVYTLRPITTSVRITLAVQDAQTLYAAFRAQSLGLLRLSQKDGIWTAVEYPTPFRLANLVIDARGVLYALSEGTGTLATSEDGGASWFTRGDPLEAASPWLLTLGADGHLYAGTLGSGVWRSGPPVSTAAVRHPPSSATALRTTHYPNPVRTHATIAFTLPHPARVTMDVYDLLGRKVECLLDDVLLSPGRHETRWAVKDHAGGLYVYRLVADGSVHAGPMVVVK